MSKRSPVPFVVAIIVVFGVFVSMRVYHGSHTNLQNEGQFVDGEPSQELAMPPTSPTVSSITNTNQKAVDSFQLVNVDVAPKNENELVSNAVDRFTLRKLDLPRPKSVLELLSKLTEYKEPVLPGARPGDQDSSLDGDMLLGRITGYYRAQDGRLEPIESKIDSGGISLSINNGPEWSQSAGDLKVKNFDGDPYSLVIFTPDRRMLYLKFYAGVEIPDTWRPPRALIGWLLSGPDMSTNVSPTAMICSDTLNTIPESDQSPWPPPAVIEKLLPKSLPSK
jgi:hypothetical protein